ncbi:hypothetical protein [Brevibacillus porteri]|uniref:Uncharacterized protein n=1 Tax=Brevibacillus porteri TaxID=2126350 RepID=A0ABX5FIS9_9BACL|nr:hypothetical protein [Brevibacillus porteri]MED1801771.1 hypothetical protein [Brevibacillus porteri]MED2134902.1 hypothetical protein [Brevibacillus porteri]MED2748409.1 hypothetical protein [Brevibacillus porteri]MED2818333.1 hypothetical protein [Brevibacillus porteri]MED2897708.1 hypothetical protein [Brevibacillus porteri]
MSFKEKLPEWLAPGTEPPESKKVNGWLPGDKPPSDYFNWLFHHAYLALKELQEKAAAKFNFDSHVNDNKKHPLYGTTAGTANAYVISFDPPPSGYTDGMEIVLKLHSDSKVGASTININNLGAKSLKKANGYDATNLKLNGIYTFRYNATTGNFILQGEGGTGNAIPSDVLVGKTFSNDAGEQTGTMQNHGAKGVIMPTTARQNFGGGYYQAFSVEGDPDLVAGNIKNGSNIFGVAGSYEAKRYAIVTGISSEKASASNGGTYDPQMGFYRFWGNHDQTGDYSNNGWVIPNLGFEPRYALVTQKNGYNFGYSNKLPFNRHENIMYSSLTRTIIGIEGLNLIADIILFE